VNVIADGFGPTLTCQEWSIIQLGTRLPRAKTPWPEASRRPFWSIW
jgi:hypothetical protein